MEDKKLIAAIVGAITTYIQMEQQPTSVTPESKPKLQVSRLQVSNNRLIKDKLKR